MSRAAPRVYSSASVCRVRLKSACLVFFLALGSGCYTGRSVYSHSLLGAGAVVLADHSISLLGCLLVPDPNSGGWYPAELDRGGPFRADGFLIQVTSTLRSAPAFEVLTMEVTQNGKTAIPFRHLEKVPAPLSSPPTAVRHEIWVPAAFAPVSKPEGALEPGTYKVTVSYRWGTEELEATWNCTYQERSSGPWAPPVISHL
jgi:hypothetical protein